MTHIFVRHRVNDYPAWKKVFDEFVDTRRAMGEKSFQVLQKDEDTNNIFLVFTWDSAENARKFFDSEKLKETMGHAGVAEKPDINFVSEADHGVL